MAPQIRCWRDPLKGLQYALVTFTEQELCASPSAQSLVRKSIAAAVERLTTSRVNPYLARYHYGRKRADGRTHGSRGTYGQ